MKSLLVLLTAGFLALPLAAQTVDMDIPTTLQVQPGFLSVTFAHGVSEHQARALIDSLGYDISQVVFEDVRVWAAADHPLTPEQLAQLNADPLVLDVSEDVRQRSSERERAIAGLPAVDTVPEAVSIHDPRFTLTSMPHHQVVFTLDPRLSLEAAEAYVENAGDLRVRRTHKQDNDIIIAVTLAEEDAALAALEATPLVKYVSYLLLTE